MQERNPGEESQPESSVIATGMTDVPVDLSADSLENLKTLAFYKFINGLDECSKSLYLVGDITEVDELATIIGKCIINAVFVDSIASMIERYDEGDTGDK